MASPRPYQLLVISTKTATALPRAAQQLTAFLHQRPETPLADAAFTLARGRRAFSHRQFLVCPSDTFGAAECPSRREGAVTMSGVAPDVSNRSVAFLLPGGGSQYPAMGRGLYGSEPEYRRHIDRCVELARRYVGGDLRSPLYGDGANARLDAPSVALPALFATEYAMARLWMHWGIQPECLIGHSMGEYTAACLAGVFSLEDAIKLVAFRGKLFERFPDGGMLSVRLPESTLAAHLNGALSVAAVNGPSSCVVSGPPRSLLASRRHCDPPAWNRAGCIWPRPRIPG